MIKLKIRATETVLVVISTLVCLVVAEIVLRALYREEVVNGNYWGRGAFVASTTTGYRHAPGFVGHVVRTNVFVSDVEINELGLRQRNLESQLEYSRRVLILGDSFAFGLGVSEGSSFAGLLQRHLNPKGLGVINGGQSGFSVVQETRFGEPLALRTTPELILLCPYLFNDIEDDYYQGYRNVQVGYGYRLYPGRFLASPAADYLRPHSYLWMLSGGVRDQLRRSDRDEKATELAKSDPNEMMGPTLAAVQELRAFAEARDIHVGVILIPARSGPTPFDAPFLTHLRSLRIPALDLNGTVSSPNDYFEGDGHWNETGHEKAAAAISSFVEGILL